MLKEKDMRLEVSELDRRYDNLINDISLIRANGNLSKLYNLRTEFDETFDQFFDDEDLRKKYNDWDYENDCILLEKTNKDLYRELDNKDLTAYIEFYKNYIGRLEDELEEVKKDNVES